MRSSFANRYPKSLSSYQNRDDVRFRKVKRTKDNWYDTDEYPDVKEMLEVRIGDVCYYFPLEDIDVFAQTGELMVRIYGDSTPYVFPLDQYLWS